ncbi:unnamed protein product [Lactuca saligna]|uniref:Retrotransposon Copia-like N-terminal domain-containing protein n=1 Tax=Lactuca saligna TaxID=75948 RepID=A0AA35VTG6_LACSI|nr:unnamed protein product [Lactuca saligna]
MRSSTIIDQERKQTLGLEVASGNSWLPLRVPRSCSFPANLHRRGILILLLLSFLMASGSPKFLNLATTTATNLNFQIPAITVKLDRTNYPLWRTTIVSALEAFELEKFVFNPQPPPEILTVPTTEAILVTATSPAIVAIPAKTTPNPEYATWKRHDRASSMQLRFITPGRSKTRTRASLCCLYNYRGEYKLQVGNGKNNHQGG